MLGLGKGLGIGVTARGSETLGQLLRPSPPLDAAGLDLPSQNSDAALRSEEAECTSAVASRACVSSPGPDGNARFMGLLRIILALSVIAGHADTTIFGVTWVDEFFSVQAFFAISGFYMALVLNEKYATLPLGAFYRSRALRIYPTYFVGVALMILVSRSEIATVMRGMSRLTRFFFYLQNTVIVGQDLSYVVCMREKVGDCIPAMFTTVNPPAWSLSVELGFYLIAPFIVRDPRRIVGFIAIGTVYLLLTMGMRFPITDVYPFNLPSEFSLRYYFYPSSFIFFGGGALAYHLRRLTIGSAYHILVAAVIAFAFINTAMPPWYLTMFALAVPELFRLTKSSRLDRTVGEFSYPLYILHWPILTFVKSHLDAFAPVLPYATVGTIVAILAGLAAAALYVTLDRPIDRLRHPSPATPHVATREPTWVKAALAAYFLLPFATLAAMVR